MPSKLIQGDKLPPITLNLIHGDDISLPEGINCRYLVLLFYRGNW